MHQRRKNLLKFCDQVGCDTLVAFEPENLFYITGFWGEGICVLKKNGTTTIITPILEVNRAKNESTDSEVIKSERGKNALSTLISKLQGSKVCTDSNNFDVIRSLKKIYFYRETFNCALLSCQTNQRRIRDCNSQKGF